MIIWGARRIQPNQMEGYISSSLRQLKSMGVQAGERVVLNAPVGAEYVILLLALWRMKAVACPVNPQWPLKMADAYASRLNTRHIFKSSDIQKAICFDARVPALDTSKTDLDLNQEATVIATSGSSGEPKAAVHTWGNHFYSAKGSQEIIPLTAQDRWLLSLPLHHVAGIAMVARCFLAGASMIIPTDKDLITAISRGAATHISLVPTQLYRLLEDPSNHPVLKSLKYILLGGSAIPPALIQRSLALGLPVYLSYGLTEMASQVATAKASLGKNSCATVLPYRQVDIAPDGEILVKGEVLFKGYVAGARLHLPLTKEGWFQTGDLGRWDAPGCLTVLGRKDNMFISGGENIQPEEIEKALLAIEGITQAMVVGRQDKEFGQRPVAFVQFQGTPIPNERIVSLLEKDLPRFKIPVAFHPWPKELEKGIKISREELSSHLP